MLVKSFPIFWLLQHRHKRCLNLSGGLPECELDKSLSQGAICWPPEMKYVPKGTRTRKPTARCLASVSSQLRDRSVSFICRPIFSSKEFYICVKLLFLRFLESLSQGLNFIKRFKSEWIVSILWFGIFVFRHIFAISRFTFKDAYFWLVIYLSVNSFNLRKS